MFKKLIIFIILISFLVMSVSAIEQNVYSSDFPYSENLNMDDVASYYGNFIPDGPSAAGGTLKRFYYKNSLYLNDLSYMAIWLSEAPTLTDSDIISDSVSCNLKYGGTIIGTGEIEYFWSKSALGATNYNRVSLEIFTFDSSIIPAGAGYIDLDYILADINGLIVNHDVGGTTVGGDELNDYWVQLEDMPNQKISNGDSDFLINYDYEFNHDLIIDDKEITIIKNGYSSYIYIYDTDVSYFESGSPVSSLTVSFYQYPCYIDMLIPVICG